ncbi:hypothetical protein VN0741_02650 [Helicobacter pylori]|uniref:hypothetical protein n=1 Tax=Helicobacter pylori TaxID=210 RepID=UPI000EAD0AF3|nr:hypothetical protein [Helicobacter pylori]WQV15425.1 hypothetical protein KVM67_00530 [Helicobacter pylori]GHP43478.1 hypothetical protein VN0223_00820 [Helicobacter pylori]GHP64078.1 hypothetical protein VN1195_08130 [Helicobacter pylori]GHQ47787.1 hypothetical protein VN0363_02740 [Helicobacter pylori]GHQ61219.1 hypothetical protein VN0390_02820 [Helicobacter pylori]
MQFPLKKDLKISQKYVIPKGFDPTKKEYKNLLVKDLPKSVYREVEIAMELLFEINEVETTIEVMKFFTQAMDRILYDARAKHYEMRLAKKIKKGRFA